MTVRRRDRDSATVVHDNDLEAVSWIVQPSHGLHTGSESLRTIERRNNDGEKRSHYGQALGMDRYGGSDNFCFLLCTLTVFSVAADSVTERAIDNATRPSSKPHSTRRPVRTEVTKCRHSST